MQGTTACRPAPARPRIIRVLALALALSATFASPAAAASPAVTHITLRSNTVYTSTGITLRAGDSVSIRASGKIHFGGGAIKAMTPHGIAAGSACEAIASKQPRAHNFPAPHENCWSLIARVADGPPIEVGDATTFRAAQPGALRLGLNDNFPDDNKGTWTASITVTRAASPASAGTTKKSSNVPTLVLTAVALLVVALLAFAWSRQRAQKKRRTAATTAAPDDLALVGAAAAPIADMGAEAVAAAAPFSAPPDPDSIDVNIFEVEFSNGLTLRIGYNHFPEGTELRWRVTQNRVLAASGSFLAQGGGSTNHIETVPLGVKLEGRQTIPDGADVQFDWSINGVPFRYSVRRDPNC